MRVVFVPRSVEIKPLFSDLIPPRTLVEGKHEARQPKWFWFRFIFFDKKKGRGVSEAQEGSRNQPTEGVHLPLYARLEVAAASAALTVVAAAASQPPHGSPLTHRVFRRVPANTPRK